VSGSGVIGNKASLAAIIASQQNVTGKVRDRFCKCRPMRKKGSSSYIIEISI
jgi:hypothetical protein